MSGYRLDHRPPWWTTEHAQAVFVMGGVLAALIVLNQFTTLEKSNEIVGASFNIGMLTWLYWAQRRELWFWGTIGIFALVHAVLISAITVSFPPGPAISYVYPSMMIDGFAMFWVLKLLARKLSPIKDDDDLRPSQ